MGDRWLPSASPVQRPVRAGSEVGGPTFHLPVAKAGGLLAFGPAPLVLIRVVVGADAVVVHHPLHRRVQVERLRLVLRLEKQLLFAVALSGPRWLWALRRVVQRAA